MGFFIIDLKDEQNALKVNVWNWRPTLEMITKMNILEIQELESMSFNGGSGKATESQTKLIAQKLRLMLAGLESNARVLVDGSVTTEPDDGEFHRDEVEKNYSATKDWLERFAEFCESCKGFYVI